MIKKTLITVGLLAVSSLAAWANQVVNGPQGWTYLRQGPSSNSPILAKLNNGQTLQIVSSTGQWYKVQMDDGTIGFVYGNTLVNGGVTASAARAAMAAHPMTSNDPQIRLQQALQQDEDFQARMDKHFAEVREAKEHKRRHGRLRPSRNDRSRLHRNRLNMRPSGWRKPVSERV